MRKNLSHVTESRNHREAMTHDPSVENKESASPTQNAQISYRANSTEDMEISDDSGDLKRVDRIGANNHNRR